MPVMTAAMTTVGASTEPSLDIQHLKRDLANLRLTLMGLKSDIDDATGPVRSATMNEEIKRGVRNALTLVDDVRQRLGG